MSMDFNYIMIMCTGEVRFLQSEPPRHLISVTAAEMMAPNVITLTEVILCLQYFSRNARIQAAVNFGLTIPSEIS